MAILAGRPSHTYDGLGDISQPHEDVSGVDVGRRILRADVSRPSPYGLRVLRPGSIGRVDWPRGQVDRRLHTSGRRGR